jgi:hypothetical protein
MRVENSDQLYDDLGRLLRQPVEMTIGTEKDGESLRCRSSMVPQAECSARRRTVSASTKPKLVTIGFDRKRFEPRGALPRCTPVADQKNGGDD